MSDQDEANRRFWDGVERVAKPVASWPDWKRRGIAIREYHFDQRVKPTAGAHAPPSRPSKSEESE